MTGRVLRALLLAVLAAAAVAGGVLARYATTEIETGPLPLQFSLSAGSSLRGAARQMESAGALRRPALFVAMARFLGAAGRIKAGVYQIDAPLTPYRLLRKVTEGEVTQAAITVVEGWTFRQLREALDSHPSVRHDSRGLSDAAILKRLKIDASSPEGLFFPNTYHFSVGSSDFVVLRTAYRLMQSQLQKQWANRAPDLPLADPYEALILASIVEKETAEEGDRPLVAAVFLNRLRRSMPLQADPTVIYGMGEAFDGNLRKRDLQADGPYNTYTRTGLPPTPIAMPGLASLAVTLNPADSDALYFVSKGDGTSYFSRSLKEHERAVTKYQKSGRR